MRRKRLTITLDEHTLKRVDSLIDNRKIRNRSHAIESVLKKSLPSSIKKALILAGGPGTRLRPFTYEIPSALIPFKGKPLLEHTIQKLKDTGITEIIICTGHLENKVVEHFGDGSKFGVSITYSKETKPLGTAGAILKAQKHLNHNPFLVIHSDVLTDINLNGLIDFHTNNKYQATLALTTVADPEPFGMVRMRGAQIVEFSEKPANKAESNLIHAGVYILNESVFKTISSLKKKKVSIEKDVFPVLAKNGAVAGYLYEGQWFDISNPKAYEKALKSFSFETG